jgi:hypothetical protein
MNCTGLDECYSKRAFIRIKSRHEKQVIVKVIFTAKRDYKRLG